MAEVREAPEGLARKGAAFMVYERATGRVYRVYLDGTVEGFADDAVVFNGIPEVVRQEVRTALAPSSVA